MLDQKICEQRLSSSLLIEMEHRKTIHNFGGTVAATHTLPLSKIGLEFQFLQLAGISLNARAAGTEVIVTEDGTTAAGGYISGTHAIMGFIKLECFIPGFWHAKHKSGTWGIH